MNDNYSAALISQLDEVILFYIKIEMPFFFMVGAFRVTNNTTLYFWNIFYEYRRGQLSKACIKRSMNKKCRFSVPRKKKCLFFLGKLFFF